MTITTIGFDADDTLWHNERLFLSIKEKFSKLLAEYHDQNFIERHLDVTETKNIKHFGYGIKGFTLSMIETACELTENRISGHEIKKILGFAREMIASPIEVLDGVNETIQHLSGKFKLMLITKGDLLDQETKLARSGLGKFFSNVEIVANKDKSSYHSILQRQHLNPKEFVMVGNSLKSDILPVLECGGKAIHIPYETEWFHEKVSDDELIDKNYLTLESIIQLLDFDWKKI